MKNLMVNLLVEFGLKMKIINGKVTQLVEC